MLVLGLIVLVLFLFDLLIGPAGEVLGHGLLQDLLHRERKLIGVSQHLADLP